MQVPFSLCAFRSFNIRSLALPALPSPKAVLGRAVASAITYALKQPAARAAILDAVMDSDYERNRCTSVDADDVDGLDRAIEQAIEDYDFEAVVDNAIDYDKVSERVAVTVMEELDTAEIAAKAMSYVMAEIAHRLTQEG